MQAEYEIRDFYSEPGIHCCFSPISNIFRYAVKDFRDDAIFLNYDGLLTEYRCDRTEHLKDIVLSNHISALYHKFFSSHRMDFGSSEYSGGFEDLQDEAVRRTHTKLPMVFSQNSLEVTYHKAYLISRGSTHYIVALGIKNGRMLIDDCFVPTNPIQQFQDYIDMAVVKKAWLSSGKRVFLINAEHLDIIRKHAANMDTVLLLKSKISRYLSDDGRTLVSFASDIGSLLDNFTLDEVRENIFSLCFKLQYDSVVPSRRKLAYILAEMRLASPEIIAGLDEILAKWYAASFSMMKYGVAGSKEGFHRLADNVKSILEQENRLLFKLLNNI